MTFSMLRRRPLYAPVTGGGGGIMQYLTPTWTPASLSGLLAWYKADVATYHDAGTTPATNGQYVTQWNDQSGHGYHLSGIGTPATDYPTLSTNTLNSLPVLDWSATGHSMSTTGSPVALGGTFLSGFMVCKVTANPNTNARALAIASAGDDTSASTAILVVLLGATTTNPGGYNAGLKSNGTIISGTWNQLGSIWDATNNTFYIANTAQTPVANTPTFANPVDITVFGAPGGANSPVGQVAEVVLTNTAVSLSDRASLATYFTTRWGI